MLAVGTLADIGRRCPQFRHRSLQTPARGFLTIPTFRLDLAPPWRGFFYAAASMRAQSTAPRAASKPRLRAARGRVKVFQRMRLSQFQPPNSFAVSLVLGDMACSIHADQTAKGKTTHRRMGMIHLQDLPHLQNDRDAIRFHRCLPWEDLCEMRSRLVSSRPRALILRALKIMPRIVKRPATGCEAARAQPARRAVRSMLGRWILGWSTLASRRETLPAGRDPCRRSKSVQIHGGGSRPTRAPVFRSFRFHLQVRRRSEWLCAYRRMRAPTRGTSRPTFHSVAARRTG